MVTALQPQPRPIVRRSLAEGLLSCGQFEMEDGEALAFGTAIHSFLAAYTLLCKSTGEETRLTDVSRLAAEAWARTPGLLQSRWTEFIDLCAQVAESKQANLDSLMYIEHTLTHEEDGILFTCTFDRMDRADFGDPDDVARVVQITDYKSERGELPHEFQSHFYSQMVLLTMPAVEQVVFAVWALRDWWTPEPMFFTRGELDLWWKATVAGVKARLAAPDAAPTGGPGCPSCAKRYECARATAVAAAIPETTDQADELFSDLLRLEEAVEVRKQGLKHFYSGHPERVVHGKEIGYLTPREPNLVVTAEPLTVMKFLNRRHMSGSSVLKVDKEQINHGTAEKLIEAGLAKREFSRPSFKWRNHVPAKEARRQKKQEKEQE